jgi:uncharacterized protein (TIGR02284 family)
MAETRHDIRTLNTLIASVIDSIDGYTEAAKNSESSRFSTLFADRAAERRQVAERLRSEVARLGGNPEDDGTALAGAHRVFINLKAAVTNRDDKAIINEVERGEDHLKSKFEDALRDNDLSPPVRVTIEDAFASVRQGHDEISELKHSFEAAH